MFIRASSTYILYTVSPNAQNKKKQNQKRGMKMSRLIETYLFSKRCQDVGKSSAVVHAIQHFLRNSWQAPLV